ncbi:VanZ family protein [Curtobacterium sp. VKM Ac-2922]|uniref:VanZ family protein n=1 Tax=Curtobacterium sp. VKM Ac-2922 TaxID=2929475 RepID=UPI001FB550DE|nr:VanZ family protein [Curtobacterium sp. VKM Ac-2922]MCJ1715240.1 VanZ family protein [Curtobacterium sp. VKM Ac-2922]
MFGEVPALPVVIPVGVVVFALLTVRLVVRRRCTLPRVAVAAALAVYAAGILANTVFPVFLHPVASSDPKPLPLVVVPFVDYEVGDAVMNMLVFVPLGVLVSLVLARPTWWRVVVTAAAISAGIEITQFATAQVAAGGHIADVNDFLWNTVGGGLGFCVVALLMQFRRSARVLAPFRGPEPGA